MKNKIFSLALAFVCCFCLLLAGCGETPKEYDINVLINGAKFGTVEDVSGTYTEGTNVTITAKPKAGETFFCWLHDGQVVSTESNYTFPVNEKNSGTYLAIFECADLEYIALESFDYLNAVPEMVGDKEQKLTEIILSFGYSPTDLYEIYVCKEEALPNSESSFVSFETIYPENTFPFAFDKTKNIYIKIKTEYTVTIGGSVDNFESETMIILDKTEIGSNIKNQEDIALSKNINVNNQDLVLEEELTNKITINFKNLSEFDFSTEESPEDEIPDDEVIEDETPDTPEQEQNPEQNPA